MKPLRTVALFLLAGGTLAADCGWAAPPRAPATIIRATGLVRLRSGATGEWVQVKAPYPLHYGDEIRTISGRAEVEFADGTRIHVNRLTSFRLENPDPAARKGVSRRVIRLMAGLLRSVVRPLKPGDSFEVVAAGAIAAVKGTDFAFDGTTVIVFDEGDPGVHVVELRDAKGERKVEVKEGEMATVRPDGTIAPPKPVPPEKARQIREASSGPDAPVATPGEGIDREILSFAEVARSIGGSLAAAREDRGPIANMTPREMARDQCGGEYAAGCTTALDRVDVVSGGAPIPPPPPPPAGGCPVLP